MPLLKRDLLELLGGLRAELRERVRNQANLLLGFFEGDDWSFVIKVHAVIEASVSELVLTHVGDSRLRPVIERLPLANEATGKLALANALHLLSHEQRAFVRRLSHLRNRVVHDVQQTGFSFQAYTATLAADDLRSWQDNIIWFPADGANRDIWRRIALDNPKLAVCVAAFTLTIDMAVNDAGAAVQRKAREFALRTGDTLLHHRGEDGQSRGEPL